MNLQKVQKISFPNFRGEFRPQAILLLLVAVVLMAASSPAQTNKYEYALPRGGVYPIAIVSVGTNLYAAEESGAAMAELTGTNTSENVLSNYSSSSPYGIVYDSSSNYIYYSDPNLKAIGRFQPGSNTCQEFTLPTDVVRYPIDMVLTSNKLWFLEYATNRIGCVSTSFPTNITNGQLILASESQVLSNTTAQLSGLCMGPDNKFWFCDFSSSKIGRYDYTSTNTNSNFVEFTLTNTGCGPFQIIAGPDGALWFSEYNTQKIGRITTNGTVTEYALPYYSSYTSPTPRTLAKGPDGGIWFTEYYGTAVGRISLPGGVISVYPTVTANSYPLGICTNSDTNLIYFTENSSASGTSGLNDQIGVILLNQSLLMTASSNLAAPSLTFSGQICTFANSNPTNAVIVNWGDGTSTTVQITNAWGTANSFITTNVVVTIGTNSYTNYLTITNIIVTGLSTNVYTNAPATNVVVTNYSNGTFAVYGSHTFPSSTNYTGSITVQDSYNNFSYLSATFMARQLGIQKYAANVAVLSWPTNGIPLSLYKNNNLSTTNWTLVTNGITSSNGINSLVLTNTGSGSAFFRLK